MSVVSIKVGRALVRQFEGMNYPATKDHWVFSMLIDKYQPTRPVAKHIYKNYYKL